MCFKEFFMAVSNYQSVTGIVQSVSNQSDNCCNLQVSLITENGIVNLIVTPETYVVNNLRLMRGMSIIAFYDADAPAVLIFPPQYRALVIAQKSPREFVELKYFNDDLVSADNTLQLNLGSNTMITTANGQMFGCNPGNHWLLVYYSATTRSIPPQTTPRRVIVMCQL